MGGSCRGEGTLAAVVTAADRDAALQPLLDRYAERIGGELRRAFAGRDLVHYSLMRYHLGWEDREGRPQEARHGKLLRPLLCVTSCEAVGGDAETSLPLAAAVELLHNFSLIHDDIEDGSPQRHGRDAVWHVWGVPQAVNAGDGVFALAHVALDRLSQAGVDAPRVLAATRLLDTASLRLCEGQYLDLAFEERLDVSSAEYLQMVSGKTAALMAAAAGSGALLGEASPNAVSAFEHFGEKLGFAFQVRDDVLGIWGESRETGKPTGEDIRERKKSFPVVFAMERAGSDGDELRTIYGKDKLSEEDVARASMLLERTGARDRSQETASRYAVEALQCLDGIDLMPERRRDLELLADYFVNREA
jgi:geranylgeranyl diphosphate synthase type I